MSLAPRLDLRQSQQLVMTPQLQQAIKLLQMNNLELEAHLATELEANPLLDLQRDDGDAAAEAPPNEPVSLLEEMRAAEPVTPPEERSADEPFADGAANDGSPLDTDPVADTFHHAAGEPGGGGGAIGEGGDIDALAAGAAGLAEHLERQIAQRLSGTNLAIARFLIDQIDEAGYLRMGLPEVCATLAITPARAEAILRQVQALDPTGVGARTLAECLGAQAREAGRLDRPLKLLFKNLEVLGRGDLAALRRICGLSQAELTDRIRYLRTLDPKPGLRFGGEPATPVQPDVLLSRTATGWHIELNGSTLPRVLVNTRYHAELARGAKGAAKAFLTEALGSANWIARALDQRARTIVAVAGEIVRQQERFFLHGVHQLRPLNLKTVAAAVGMHESTISRVTSNKYLQCERGLFELKYFFAPALALAGGNTSDEGVSTTSIKRRIAELIAAESADGVQSDDQLVERLRGEGFDVARRTVAKYREGLGLGSSVQRRRRFAMRA